MSYVFGGTLKFTQPTNDRNALHVVLAVLYALCNVYNSSALSLQYNCMQFVIASLQIQNAFSGADTDIVGPRNAFYIFCETPERHGIIAYINDSIINMTPILTKCVTVISVTLSPASSPTLAHAVIKILRQEITDSQ